MTDRDHAMPARCTFFWWWIVGSVLLTLLAYRPTFDAPFVFDDRAAILDNPTIRQLWPLSAPLTPPADGRAVAGRPLVNLSLALNYAWSGADPWTYHGVNLAIHLLAAALLLGLVRRTLTVPVLRERWSASASVVAGLVAVLWALHPLQTESVTCVVQRTESLAGFFYLLTLYAFVRGAAPSPGSRRWLGLSVAACLLGMATKETMVTAPVIVWLYDRTFLAGAFRRAWRERRGYHLALVSTWLLLAWLLIRGGGGRGTAAGFGAGMSSWSYLLQQCRAVVLYLKLSLWPDPLVVDYGSTVPGSLADVAWQALVVLVLVGATGWALVRRPVLGFFGAWFFVILAPSSSFVPLAAQTMAEHRMYLPLAAVIVLLVVAIHAVAVRRAVYLGIPLIVAAAFLTWRRNEIYRTELALWSDTVAHQPNNPRAVGNLGSVLLEAGRLAEALDAFQRAERLQPNSPSVHSNLCNVYLRLGRLPEAVAQGEAALALEPGGVDAHVNLGHAFLRLGRPAEAVPHFEAAWRAQPDALDLRVDLGDALMDRKTPRDAIPHYEAALALEPRSAEVQRKLGNAFLRLGDRAAARTHLGEALKLNPADAETLFAAGNLAVAGEDFPSALAAYRRAVELAPTYVAARNNLANVLLVAGRFDDAIAEYRAILRLRPDDPAVRENLARAQELQAAPAKNGP